MLAPPLAGVGRGVVVLLLLRLPGPDRPVLPDPPPRGPLPAVGHRHPPGRLRAAPGAPVPVPALRLRRGRRRRAARAGAGRQVGGGGAALDGERQGRHVGRAEADGAADR